MKTTIHYYLIDISRAPGKREFSKVRAEARKGGRKEPTIETLYTSKGIAHRSGIPFEIVTESANRLDFWNLIVGDTNGLKGRPWLSSWAEFRNEPHIREGYYITITDEMRDYLDAFQVCPNCMHVTDKNPFAFHLECLATVPTKADIWRTFYVPLSVASIQRRNIYVTPWVIRQWEERQLMPLVT